VAIKLSNEAKEKSCFGTINAEKIKNGDCNSCSEEKRQECLYRRYDNSSTAFGKTVYLNNGISL